MIEAGRARLVLSSFAPIEPCLPVGLTQAASLAVTRS